MINIIHDTFSPLGRFIEKFSDIFSKSQKENFKVYSLGLLLPMKRASIEVIDEMRIERGYDALHHFMKEAPWEEEEVNKRRLYILISDKRTRPSQEGVLVIDDTSSKEKSGENTEGIGIQYSGREKKLMKCNVVVTSHYVDKKKDYPVGLSAYIPEEKIRERERFLSKVDRAKILVSHARENGVDFGEVLFDNWYFGKGFVQFIEGKGKDWTTTLAKDQIIYVRGKRYTVERLVKSLDGMNHFKEMTKVSKRGKEEKRYIYGVNIGIKGIRGRLRMVVCKTERYSTEMKEIEVIVTNKESGFILDREIVEKWGLRWDIENFYRDAHDNLHFSEYQVRDMRTIKRHWYVVFFDYSYLVLSRMRGNFSKLAKRVNMEVRTIGDCINLLRRRLSYNFVQWLMRCKKNLKVFIQHIWGEESQLCYV